MYAEKDLYRKGISISICEFMLERSFTFVIYEEKDLIKLVVSFDIRESIRERNVTCVTNVERDLIKALILLHICQFLQREADRMFSIRIKGVIPEMRFNLVCLENFIQCLAVLLY